MWKLSLFAAGLTGLVVLAAHAASFDCAKATRPVEKLICGDPKLNSADERLGQTYRVELMKLPPAAIGLLRVDQVQWLAWLQEICHAPLPDATAPGAPPTTSSADVIKCMLPLYDKRAKLLRGIEVERDGVRFITRTKYLAAPEETAALGSPEFRGFGTLQASWPFALADGPKWQVWNRAVEVRAHSMVANGGPPKAAEALQRVRWSSALAEGADTNVTVHIMRVEHGRVTSAASMNTMGHGAAHPSEASETMTWLLQATRALRAGDVFQIGDAWKAMLAQACWRAIHTGGQASYVYPQVTGPNANELQRVIADVANWTLEHDGLHISYPEYSVSPRIAMVDDTVVPWAALQPVLAEGFTVP